MKIIHVISSCSAGGAEILVKNLLIEMKKQGANVRLWIMTQIKDTNQPTQQHFEFEKTYLSELELYKVPYDFILKRPNKDWFKAMGALNRLYNIHRPEIIHAHLESVAFHVALALFLRQVTLVQTIHSSLIHNPLLVKIFFAKAYKKFVAISEVVEHTIIQAGVSQKKVQIIKNGINVDRFYNIRAISAQVTSIIAIGRLTKAKDYENLILAIAFLKYNLIPNNLYFPKTIIVGEGELRNKLNQMVKEHKLENDIEFLGLREDIPELLRKSDIYVMSSEWEGLSISLIEALASGIPIITTNAGSNKEIIEHEKSGIIVPIKNSHALAEGIFRLINDFELRNELSLTAIKKSSFFTIVECAINHINFYNALVKRKEERFS
jgi:L-malate glycosyltransferase